MWILQSQQLHDRVLLGIFAEHAEDFALDADARGLGVDGGHFGVGGLEADEIAFAVKALEGGIGAVDEGYYYFAFAGGAGSFHKYVVAGDNVLVAHGVAADFQSEDFAVADNVAERDALGGFDGFYRLAGGDAAEQWEAVEAFTAGPLREHVNGAAAVVGTLKKALVLQVGDVFVDRRKRAELQASGDLLIGGRVAVLGREV